MPLDDIILGSKTPQARQGGEPQKKSQYLGNLFKKLIAGSRASNEIPEADDFKYYASYPTFKSQVENISQRVLILLDKLSSFANPEHEAGSLITSNDDASRFDVLVENVDHTLERCDLHLDDMLGLSKTAPAKDSVVKNFNNLACKRRSKILMKPQRKFQDKIDNSTKIWIPIIREKPNALTPLPDYDSGDPQVYCHPYLTEIQQLHYLKSQVSACKEQVYQPLNEVKCHWIDTEEQLNDLSTKLDQVTEFAVDLEHHNHRSYLGFVCLMQISIRNEDFLIDTLKLRHHIHILNSSFTNPLIVKVFHGSDNDILWLQRDFGVYVVNLFDTNRASKALGLRKKSLAFLLLHYCEVRVDKKYQLADWRVRALPTEMLLYARQDTHYLLYIYDRMRNDLIQQNQIKPNPDTISIQVINSNGQKVEVDVPELLGRVLEASKRVSLTKFFKDKFTPKSRNYFAKLDQKSHMALHGSRGKMAAFAALWQWRDAMARKEDESVWYVLPNRSLLAICIAMPLDSQSLNKSCHPLPPYVRQNAVQLIEIIHNSKSAADYENPNVMSAPYMISQNPHSPYTPPLSSSPNQISKKKQALASPVLSTNELYESAGWVNDDKISNKHHNILKLSGDGSSVPLFDISGVLESYKTGSRRKNRDVLLSPCPQSMAASSLLDFSTPMVNDDNPETTRLKKKAREIHNSFNSPQSTIQLFSTPNINTVKSYANKKKRKSLGDDVPFSSLVSPTPPSLQTVPSPDLDKAIPRSMREIYQMSNKNRSRNKEKKKLKQSARIDPTPVFKDVPGSGSVKASSRSDRLIENEEKFMKNIGWLKGNMKDVYPGSHQSKGNTKKAASPHRQVKQSSNESRGSGKSKFSNIKNILKKHKKKNTSGGGKSKSFHPYDYSQANPRKEANSNVPDTFFNPYANRHPTAGKKRYQKNHKKQW